MILQRHILLFGFLALLGGCASHSGTFISPCAAPGNLKEGSIYNCYYVLTVIDKDKEKNIVKGKVREDVAKFGNSDKRELVYTFRLRDFRTVESQIQNGESYHFIREGDSPYLELFPQKPEVEKE